jgi:hypothetical protein
MDTHCPNIAASGFENPQEFWMICVFLFSTHTACIIGQNLLAHDAAHSGIS